jgi:hypothetical protein
MKTGQTCNRWREAIRAWIGEGVAGEQTAQIQDHLATCAECRHYAEELRAAAAGLRWLADQPVEPSPGFRARWTQAVEDTVRPRGSGKTAAALLAWWRELLLRNLRPTLGVASLWILALLFRLSAPDVSPATPDIAARSPVEIVRALRADQRLLAWHFWRWDPLPSAPRPARPPHPRSERLPAQPTVQSEHLPDAYGTVEMRRLRPAGTFPNCVAADVSRRHLGSGQNAPTDVGGYTVVVNRAEYQKPLTNRALRSACALPVWTT